MVLQPKLLFYLISNSPYTWFYHLFLLSRNFSTSLGTQGKIYVFMFYYMKRKKKPWTNSHGSDSMASSLRSASSKDPWILFRNQGLQVPPAPQGPSLLAACKLPQWRPGTVVLRDCHVSPFQNAMLPEASVSCRAHPCCVWLLSPSLWLASTTSSCIRKMPRSFTSKLSYCGLIMQNTLSVILTAICVSGLIKNWWEFSFSWKSVFRRK